MRHRESLHLSAWIARSLCSSAGRVPTRQRCVRRPIILAERQTLGGWGRVELRKALPPGPVHTNVPMRGWHRSGRRGLPLSAASRASGAAAPCRPASLAGWPLVPSPVSAAPAYRPAIGACVLSLVYGRRHLVRPLFGGFRRRTIHHPDPWMGIPPRFDADRLAQRIQHVHPHLTLTQFPRVIVDRLIRRKVMGQRFPAATVAGDVENRVQQFAWRMPPFRAARVAPLREQRFDLLPWLVT